MYEKLVERLRKAAGPAIDFPDTLYDEAADAIEALKQTVEHYHGCSEDWYKEACDYKAMLPRWIPATERLPDVGETILDVIFSVDVLGFDGWTYRRAYYNYTHKIWINGNDEQEWPEITHWMQLPAPPKEEIK